MYRGIGKPLGLYERKSNSDVEQEGWKWRMIKPITLIALFVIAIMKQQARCYIAKIVFLKIACVRK